MEFGVEKLYDVGLDIADNFAYLSFYMNYHFQSIQLYETKNKGTINQSDI